MRRATLPTALLLSLLPLLAAPAAAIAQAARPAAGTSRGPASGVLLGIAGRGTLWIAPDSSGRLRARGPSGDLVVRRASGFWRIGVVQAAVEEDTTAEAAGVEEAPVVEVEAGSRGSAIEESMAPDSSDAAPVEEIAEDASDVAACAPGGACEELGDWFATAVVAAPVASPELAAIFREPAWVIEDLRRTEGNIDLEVTFVGARWLSWTESLETLDPIVNTEFGAALVPIDSVASPHLVRVLAGTPAPLELGPASIARHRRECSKQYVRSDSHMVGDADLFKWPARSWFLQHLSGRWRLTERFSIGLGAMQGFVFDCILSDTLPASLVGHDRLAPSWAEIRRQIPAATDAVSSPSGDLVVVATDEWLRVYAPRGVRLGPPLLVIPLSFPRIVAAQWATGGEVEEWTRALAAHLESER